MDPVALTQKPSHQIPITPLHIEYIRALELLESQLLTYIEDQALRGEYLNMRIFQDLFNKAKWSLR
jgi:hypothetical protein